MKAPFFWSAGLDPYSREAAPLTRAILTPLSALYAYITARKIAKAVPFVSALPVICIGNVTTGGNGKTPVAKAIRDLLNARGLPAATLSRGHGGKLKGPLKVDPLQHTAHLVGDEPMMLAKSGETWISRDRVAGATEINKGNARVVIMDDGHQNPSLHKDISLLVIDAGAPFGNGYVVPKGPLREPVAKSLMRADGVILMGDGPVPEVVKTSEMPVHRCALKPVNRAPVAGRLIAFAGIGRPQRFFDGLRAAGADVRDDVQFADHHRYSEADLKRLRAMAVSEGARLITTEKDFARIAPEHQADIIVFQVEARFENPDALMDQIFSKIGGPPDE